MSIVVTFGEIMARYTPPGFLRLRQALPGPLEVTFGGAEANVAASIATLGQSARFVTALPANPIGEACLAFLRGVPVDVSMIAMRPETRIGAYYVETGANQRPSSVTYDRFPSAISTAPPKSWDWDAILDGADWFHTTGITPALSEELARAVEEGVRRARDLGVTVSLDLNFRGKLWKWGPGPHGTELARRTVSRILPYVDVLVGNEQDADDMLDIRAEGTDVTAGRIEAAAYESVARQIAERYPGIRHIAITLRESISATHNRWGAMLFDVPGDRGILAPIRNGVYSPHEIRAIVDRVGAGDSFSAALIYALRDAEIGSDPEGVLEFAVAASSLAHSVVGDINFVSRTEVEKLVGGNASGRVER